MVNLHNIVVFIKDEAMLQEAREMLLANGQLCSDSKVFWSIAKEKQANYLRLGEIWWIGYKTENDRIITLTELETLLKHKQDGTIQS